MRRPGSMRSRANGIKSETASPRRAADLVPAMSSSADWSRRKRNGLELTLQVTMDARNAPQSGTFYWHEVRPHLAATAL